MPNYSEWQRRALAAEARCQVLIAEIEAWKRGSDYLGAEVLRLRSMLAELLKEQCGCPMCEAQGPTLRYTGTTPTDSKES